MQYLTLVKLFNGYLWEFIADIVVKHFHTGSICMVVCVLIQILSVPPQKGVLNLKKAVG
jgi:hypothetical protein